MTGVHCILLTNSRAGMYLFSVAERGYMREGHRHILGAYSKNEIQLFKATDYGMRESYHLSVLPSPLFYIPFFPHMFCFLLFRIAMGEGQCTHKLISTWQFCWKQTQFYRKSGPKLYFIIIISYTSIETPSNTVRPRLEVHCRKKQIRVCDAIDRYPWSVYQFRFDSTKYLTFLPHSISLSLSTSWIRSKII